MSETKRSAKAVSKEVLRDEGDTPIGVRIFATENPEVEARIMLADLSPEMLAHAAAHGLSQKGGDSYASMKDVSPEEKVETAGDQFARIRDAGDWNAARVSSGGSSLSLLVRAVAKVYGFDTEAAKAKVDELDDEKLKQVRNSPKIIRAIAELRAERAAAKGNDTADALFA